ncbi:MAG: MFS transporter [Treponema sp.]|nr:MFS transporter [Treponema sp.]
MERKKLLSRLGYGCGDIFGGGGFLIVNLLIMNFLVIVEGLSVVQASTIVFICKIYDGITDPVMGFISDRTHSRFGRRRLFFLIGAPVVLLSCVLLWNSFGISNNTLLMAYHLLTYILFDTAFTMVMVPYNAILSDMTDDYTERTGYTSVRMLFSATACLVCAVVPALLINVFGNPVNGPLQKPGYAVMGLVFGVFFCIAWIVTFLGTWENPQFIRSTKTHTGLRDWANMFKNKSYRNFLGIFIFVQVTIDLVLALFVFFVDIVLMKYQVYSLLMGILLVCQIIYMAVMGKIAEIKGKRFPLFIALPVFAATCLIFLTYSPSTPVWFICLISALTAAGPAAGNVCTWSMLSDNYDLDELITGKRHEGLYSGFTTFVYKLSSGLAILIIGFGLERAGFNQEEYNLLKTLGTVDFSHYTGSSIVWAIKVMIVFVPIALQALAIFFTLRYKLDNRRFGTVKRAIERFKRDGKAAALSAFGAGERADLETVTGLRLEDLWGEAESR